MKIAITGGIGSGKSTVASIIEELGYPVFSCDKIYAEMLKSEDFAREIAKMFPAAIRDGKIDKKRLSQIVFSSDEARKQLNALSHPLIMARLLEKMDACSNDKVFAEVPLLFEENFEPLFDKIIVIQRSVLERSAHLQKRDGLTISEIRSRMNVQIDYDSAETKRRFESLNVALIKNDNISVQELCKKTRLVVEKL